MCNYVCQQAGFHGTDSNIKLYLWDNMAVCVMLLKYYQPCDHSFNNANCKEKKSMRYFETRYR